MAGIGGMATHPEHLHKGFGSALLKATERFMRDELHVPFGLLICAYERRRLYELARWQFAADKLYYITSIMDTRIMPCCGAFFAPKNLEKAHPRPFGLWKTLLQSEITEFLGLSIIHVIYKLTNVGH